MAPETKWEQIQALREKATRFYEESSEAMARAYECEAAIERLNENELSAAFHDSLVRCYRERSDEATKAKDEAYARLVAARAGLDSGRTLEVP